MAHNQRPKIAFLGSPALCLPVLEALRNAGFMPSLIVTNPDRAIGRHQSELQPTPVKEWALKHEVEVFQPKKLTDEAYERLTQEDWDLWILFAYGKIIPQRFIDIPKHGILNIHPSLLPRHRGATPVEAAILAGDTTTGITIQQMRFKLDSGPIVAQEEVSLSGNEFARDLGPSLVEHGARMLIDILPKYLNGDIEPVEQDESNVTTCGLTQKSDGEITLGDDPEILWRKYRAYMPWPGLFFFDENGKRVKITEAEYGGQHFNIKKIIREGEKETEY